MKRLLYLLPVFIHRITGRLPFQPKPGKASFANIAEGVAENGRKTFPVDAATVTAVAAYSAGVRRYLLYKRGSDTSDSIAVCTASSDKVLGSSNDDPSNTHNVSNPSYQSIAVNLFGAVRGTVLVVAAGSIADGALLMPTTAGQVTTYVNAAGNYVIGRAVLGSDAGTIAAGTVIEMIPILPQVAAVATT